MSAEVNLPEKTSLTNPDMENKENADGSAWNQVGCSLEKSSMSPSSMNSSAILKETSRGVNCGPDAITTTTISKDEPAEMKNLRMSFSHTFILKKNAKEKQLKTATQNSIACLPRKSVLGSYRGKIVSSKINSFRKPPEDEERKYSLTASSKPVAKTESTKDQVPNTANASKSVHIVSRQTKPPVKVSVCQPKPIVNHDKPSVKTSSVNKMTVQKQPNKNWKPELKTVPCHAAKSEPRPKKSVPPTGALAGSVPGSNNIMRASVGNRKSALLQSAEARRCQLAEWQTSKRKALKKPPTPLSTDARPATEVQQTVKETVESFWAAIAEEDEQQLFSDTVNKTLTECLFFIEKGYSSDKIHSTLEELIQSIPDAKRLAKYWVCRMRLEQLGTLEKVMTVYEEAILAGAQPRDELRNALTDVIRDIKSLSRSSGECCKEDICTEEANLDEKVEAQQNSEVKPNNEETSPKAEACLKPKEESFLGDEELKIIKSSQMPKEYKKEQNVSETPKNIIFKTPENDKGSYSIKYNVSTTPSLNSVTEKLRSENSKTAVKDLKVLTPVRRSRRLHEKVYKLPDMLKDHNPCISSLEQLGELGGEATAFVYRPNSALHKVLEGEENLTLQN
ncbi:cytoskeleton-associated protein 2 [Sphaerodactylus townsendi]|uniref:cytoskeleton-associated protein 2 n=1 Tax=Sphaerodactylus townsendi TaxID=933632 RepID=UPI0020265C57|nr:cytoskeleton-associated protein 2 [Sphaerodactylus townsendi]XP_048355450.1 cytoskeleton-associated protein 2 [Sphaerodactylus townsendi]